MKKYRKRKMPKYFFIISIALFLFLGIGYSIIYSNLSVQGSVVRKGNSWSIGFANPVFDTGSITTPTPTITNGTTMTMNVSLTNPGDKYAFTVDLKNTGNVPALIQTLNITQLTAEQQNYLRWKVEYEDESTPEVGDLLKAGETKKLHIYLEYKNLRAIDLYPSSNVNLTLTIAVNFYLPEETYNTVTLTKNGSTKTIQVSNLEQEVTLTDFPIESTDQVIACNNGIEPSTNANDKIVLSKVKQNATCRIEQSLSNAVTNSSTEITNIAILQNSTTTAQTNIASNQNIKLNLNGKKYTYSGEQTSKLIYNNGNIIINGKKENSELYSTSEWLIYNNSGTLNINYGTYTKNSTSTTGAVISGGGLLTIRNATLTIFGTSTLTIYTRGDNSIFNIYNTTINNSQGRALANWGNSNIMNIRDSIINASETAISPSNSNSTNKYLYICKSTINLVTGNQDFETIDSASKVFYSTDTIFNNGTNNPTVPSANSKNIMRSNVACAE